MLLLTTQALAGRIAVNDAQVCAVGLYGAIDCGYETVDVAAEPYKSVSVYTYGRCYLRKDGELRCDSGVIRSGVSLLDCLDGTCCAVTGKNVECWGAETSTKAFSSFIAEIEVGSTRTCVLTQSQQLYCWFPGKSQKYVLGNVKAFSCRTAPCLLLSKDGTLFDWTPAPTDNDGDSYAISDMTGVTGVSCGAGACCVLLSDETVMCRGANSAGQTATNSPDDVVYAFADVNLQGVTHLTHGASRVCFIAGGEVHCAGSGLTSVQAFNRLTTGDAVEFHVPAPPNSFEPRVATSGGWVCVSENAGIRCYDESGFQTSVQIGAMTPSAIAVASDMYACGEFSSIRRVACWNHVGMIVRTVNDVTGSLTCGSARCCAVNVGYETLCWPVGGSDDPEIRESVRNVISYDEGLQGSCSLDAFGTVLCGKHVMAQRATQLSVGDVYGVAVADNVGYLWDMSTFTRETLGEVSAVHSQGDRACFRNIEGWVCKGDMSSLGLGHVGREVMSDSDGYTKLTGDRIGFLTFGDTETYCGGNTVDGVSCWGFDDSARPGDVVVSADLAEYVETGMYEELECAAAGVDGNSGCVAGVNGTVTCWGLTDPGIVNATEVEVTGSVICARVESGEVICLGDQRYSVLSDARSLSCHGARCCAVDVIVGSRCWDAASGVLEAAVLDETLVALGAWQKCATVGFGGSVRCDGGDYSLSGTVEALAVGGEHACALLSYGSVACWGSNANGQLGKPTLDTMVPAVPGITKAVSVAVDGDWSCALEADGRTYCWGKIGSSDPVASAVLVEVPDGFLGVSLGAGGGKLCITSTAGELFCWDSSQVFPQSRCADDGLPPSPEPSSSYANAPDCIPWVGMAIYILLTHK